MKNLKENAIRPMTAEDYEGVYALWLSCRGMGLNDVDDSASGFLKFLRRNPTTCFVAEEQGRVIGAVMAGNDGRRGYLYHTAVAPSHRRRGIGRALVSRALDALKAEGVTKVALVAFSRNAEAAAFWQGLGFTPRGDLAYFNRELTAMQRKDT